MNFAESIKKYYTLGCRASMDVRRKEEVFPKVDKHVRGWTYYGKRLEIAFIVSA